MYENKVIKRIPGAPPVSAKEKQGYLEDLCKLSKLKLAELLERQNALLRNTSFINRLPDKGVKILAFKSRIEYEIDQRKEVDKAAALLERLGINGPVEEIEWTGAYSSRIPDKEEEVTIEDDKVEDEEAKALRIIASHGRTSKVERILKPPDKLITDKDLEEVSVVVDSYAKALCGKVTERSLIPVRESFKPFRTLKSKGDSSPRHRASNSLNESHMLQESMVVEAEGVKEMENLTDLKVEKMLDDESEVKRERHWEVTAATPPPPIHGMTQMLGLEESIALEKAAVEKTIEARTTQSMMRLAEQLQRVSVTQYREVKEESSDDEEDDEDNKKKEEPEEVGDEEEERERDVALIYSVVDCNEEAD